MLAERATHDGLDELAAPELAELGAALARIHDVMKVLA